MSTKDSSPLDTAVRAVEAYCARRISPEMRDRMRLEVAIRGSQITIVERRPPWREDYGPEWSSMPIARMRNNDDGTWTLRRPDSNDGWHDYQGFERARRPRP